MARKMRIKEEELQQARKLRDEATTVTEFRKAMAVILIAELGLDSYRTAELLGTSRCTVFRDRLDVGNQEVAVKKAWGGLRHFCLSLEEEQEFL
jgi:Tat protein secretion system quality control protein TatD with DNase activity